MILERKTKIKLKLKFEKFIKYELWQHIIVIPFVFFCAWLFNKYAEAIMFCISHTTIRFSFNKQYHCTSVVMCLLLTLTIAFFGIMVVLPTSISLLSSIPIAFAISAVGYVIADRIDCKKEIQTLEARLDSLISELQSYKHIDIYNMSEDELRQYAASQGLSETQIDILCMRIYQHLRISEMCDYLMYSRSTIKYHLEQIKKKLNIITFP